MTGLPGDGSFVPNTTTMYNNVRINGLFLDQRFIVPGSAYYSLQAPDQQSLGGAMGQFMGWTSTTAQFQNATSSTSAVRFLTANDLVEASYKWHLASGDPAALGSSGQRKLLSTAWPDGEYLHAVYESGQGSFYTMHDPVLNTWSTEKLVGGLPGGAVSYTRPTLIHDSTGANVLAVYDKIDAADYNHHYIAIQQLTPVMGEPDGLDNFHTGTAVSTDPAVATCNAAHGLAPAMVAAYSTGTDIRAGMAILEHLGNYAALDLSTFFGTGALNSPTKPSVAVSVSPGNTPYHYDIYIAWQEPGGVKMAYGRWFAQSHQWPPSIGEVNWDDPAQIITLAANGGGYTYSSPALAINGEGLLLAAFIRTNAAGQEGNVVAQLRDLGGGLVKNSSVLQNCAGAANYPSSLSLCDYRNNPAYSTMAMLTYSLAGGGLMASQGAYTESGYGWTVPSVVSSTGFSISLETSLSSDKSDRKIAYLTGTGPYQINTAVTLLGRAPAPVTLAAPPNAAVDQPLTVSLQWNCDPGAWSYRLTVSPNSSFTGSGVRYYDGITTTSYSPAGLFSSQQYWWKVEAAYDDAFSAPSQVRTFTTAAGQQQIALTGTVVNSHPVFTWTGVTGNASLIKYQCAVTGGDCQSAITIYYGPPVPFTDYSCTVANKLTASAVDHYYISAAGSTSNMVNFYDGVINLDKRSIDGPIATQISGAYPNPFNPATNIDYSLADAGFVSVSIFSSLGQEVARLVNGEQPAGSYSIPWNGSGLASGIYFVRMQVIRSDGNVSYQQMRKLMLMK